MFGAIPTAFTCLHWWTSVDMKFHRPSKGANFSPNFTLGERAQISPLEDPSTRGYWFTPAIWELKGLTIDIRPLKIGGSFLPEEFHFFPLGTIEIPQGMLSSIFEPCCIRTAELYVFNCEGKWQQHPKPAQIQVIFGPLGIPKLMLLVVVLFMTLREIVVWHGRYSDWQFHPFVYVSIHSLLICWCHEAMATQVRCWVPLNSPGAAKNDNLEMVIKSAGNPQRCNCFREQYYFLRYVSQYITLWIYTCLEIQMFLVWIGKALPVWRLDKSQRNVFQVFFGLQWVAFLVENISSFVSDFSGWLGMPLRMLHAYVSWFCTGVMVVSHDGYFPFSMQVVHNHYQLLYGTECQGIWRFIMESSFWCQLVH